MTGVIASMLILPTLVQTPELMIAAVASWVALCVYVSLLDRSPRNYAFLLSGYTVALVGLPLIGDVSQLFDIGVARIEEIIIGASSAVLVHSLLFPRTLKSQMDAKLGASLKDARAWMTAALSPQGSTAAEQAARRRLARRPYGTAPVRQRPALRRRLRARRTFASSRRSKRAWSPCCP